MRFAAGRGSVFDQSRLDKRGVDLPVADALQFGEALLGGLDRSLGRLGGRDDDAPLAGGYHVAPAGETVHEANAVGAAGIAMAVGGALPRFPQVADDLVGLL